MDGQVRPQDPELMRVNPRQARQERRARELADLEAFRTVRRVADEDLRAMASTSPTSPEVAAARTALEAATTAEDVVALEPLVRRAGSVLGVDVPEDRTVRIAERWVAWTAVGASYDGVVAASRAAEAGTSPDGRNADYGTDWDARNYWLNQP
jgi:hypothetical protein